VEPDDEQTVVQWCRIVVAEVAPGELPLMAELSRAHFGGGITMDSPDRDALLGFGVDAAVALATPALLMVCQKLWDALSQKAAEATLESVGTLLHRLRRRLGRQISQLATADGFSPAELELIRSTALDASAGLGLSEDRRRLLADAIVGSLILPDRPAAAK